MTALLTAVALSTAFLLGPDGEMDHWLVSRPVAEADARGPAARPADRALGWAIEQRLRPGGLGAVVAAGLPGGSAGVSGGSASVSAPALALGEAPRTARYLYAEVVLKRPFRGFVELGSDDGVTLWIDGVERLAVDRPRSFLADDDAVPVRLAAGRHRLVAKVVNRTGASFFAARLHRKDHPVPEDARVELPGAAAVAAVPWTAEWSFEPAAHPEGRAVCGAGAGHGKGGPGYAVDVRLHLPVGAPADVPPAPLRLTLGGAPCLDLGPTDAARLQRGVSARIFVVAPGPVALSAVWGDARPDAAADGRAGPPAHSDRRPAPRVELAPAAIAAHLAALPAPGGAPPFGDPSAAHAAIARSREALLAGRPFDLAAALADAARGPERGGLVRWPAPPGLDGLPRSYFVQLPATPPPPAGYAALVLLHAFQHPVEPVLRLLLAEPGMAGVAVVAPHGYGDIVFRGPGEHDVLDALDWLAARVPVDRDRVWLTGISMGGMAAFELAVRHPDLFAAAAPVCGASDWRTVWSLRDADLTPWERVLFDAHSAASLAENGPPMFCVHGARDRVNLVRNSRPLVDAYRRLGKTVRFETPPLGHEVWPWLYGTGRLLPFLSGQTRPMPSRHVASGDRVVLVTPSVGMTPARRAWIGIDAVRSVGPPARLEAVVSATPGGPRVEVRSRNVLAFHLDLDWVTPPAGRPTGDWATPPASQPAGDPAPAGLTIDGQAIPLPSGAGRPAIAGGQPPGGRAIEERLRPDGLRAPALPPRDRVQLALTDGRWHQGLLPELPFPGRKRPGLAGPADAVFGQPVRIVYGTGEPGAVGHLRALAERLARYRDGADLRLPVVPDTAVTPAERATTALVLVGTPAQNRLLAEVLPSLPLRVDAKGLALGGVEHRGTGLGALVGYPDPLAPGRPLLVVTGTDVAGVLLARHLPELVPDYLVYGPEVAEKTGGKILATRRVKAGGYFGSDWQVRRGR